MKKITFLFTLLTVSIGFTQNLIQDGGFDTQTSIPLTKNPYKPCSMYVKIIRRLAFTR